MTQPVVSVLVDTYNHERYIEQAVVSVIEQDFPAGDYEIVVVDDGSTDRTREIVRKFAPRVRLLSKRNGGQASAFNVAIPELRGEIVTVLDGDDWFAPAKLRTVIAALNDHPAATAVGHAFQEVDEQGNGTAAHTLPEAGLFELSTPSAAREAVSAWHFLFTSTITVRREALRCVMPIAEELVYCADGPIAMAALAGGAYVVPAVLMYYRKHAGSFHLADPADREGHLRMLQRINRTFEINEATLIRLGVSRESAAALLYTDWASFNRMELAEHGGSRLRAFRTEMKAFRVRKWNRSLAHRLFKYALAGGGALLLPPRLFYRARDWYGRRNLRVDE